MSLSQHEYNTACRLKGDSCLYVVFKCATTPEVYTACNPARLHWPLLESFSADYPEAVGEQMQRGGVHKVEIQAYREMTSWRAVVLTKCLSKIASDWINRPGEVQPSRIVP